jgi:SRSO17 transposase
VRRAEAGVPEELVFRNKVELAEGMLERAFEADVPARWVVVDSFYARSHAFRVWLEERGRPYAVISTSYYKISWFEVPCPPTR